MSHKGPANPERAFGLSVGGVLCVLAALLAWRGRTATAEAAAIVGAVLVVCALLHPPLLKYPSAFWWRFARALGYVNARILLTLLFAIVLVPLSAIWRLIGKDPLARSRNAYPGWSAYPERYRNHQHYSRMY